VNGTEGGDAGLWDSAHDYIRIVIEEIEVAVRVGLHPWEQHAERPNRLLVSVDLYAHLPPLSVRPSSDVFVDYDPVRHFIRAWSTREQTGYLETLADELTAFCFSLPFVEACRITILKPDIFADAKAVGIELYRRREVSAQ
jgi:dihydroneopterin aldolase